MTTTPEDLRAWKLAYDTEITELKKDIKLFDGKIKAGVQLTPAQEKAYDGWRSRLSELTQQNTRYSTQLGSITIAEAQAKKPSEKTWEDYAQEGYPLYPPL